MKTDSSIHHNLVVKGIRFPSISPKDNRHSLPIVVELQAATSNSIHNRCIMNNSRLDSHLVCPVNKIRVRRCSVWVTDDLPQQQQNNN